ncbi:MAG: hypothetical protein AAGB12_12785 [Pseudomonadota bacterium]
MIKPVNAEAIKFQQQTGWSIAFGTFTNVYWVYVSDFNERVAMEQTLINADHSIIRDAVNVNFGVTYDFGKKYFLRASAATGIGSQSAITLLNEDEAQRLNYVYNISHADLEFGVKQFRLGPIFHTYYAAGVSGIHAKLESNPVDTTLTEQQLSLAAGARLRTPRYGIDVGVKVYVGAINMNKLYVNAEYFF